MTSILLQLLIAVATIAMTLPVILMIGIFSKLGAAARNERFATLRLIGATPFQVAAMAGIDTALVGAVGSVTGAAIAQALRPILAAFPIAGQHLRSSDMALPVVALFGIVLAMTLISSVATAIGVHRLGISPLGANRHLAERMPTAIRLAPLGVGLALVAILMRTHTSSSIVGAVELGLMVLGFLSSAVGVIIAGPLLTYLFSKVMSKYVRSSAGMIAASRICSSPTAVFRAASGLVLTIFFLSFIYAISDMNVEINHTNFANGTTTATSALPDSVIVAGATGTSSTIAGAQGFVAKLKSVQGILGAAASFKVPGRSEKIEVIPMDDAAALGLPHLSGTLNYETIDVDAYLNSGVHGFVPRAIQLTPEYEAKLIPGHIIAVTNGDEDSMERARTSMAEISDYSMALHTRFQPEDSLLGPVRDLYLLANFVIVLIILISGCSLSVAAMVGMIDRRRAFGLLRLVGMPVIELKKIVVIEAAVPLAAATLFSAAMGFVMGALINGGMNGNYRVNPPSVEYYGTIGIGMAIAALVIACTAQMANKATAGTSTRFE